MLIWSVKYSTDPGARNQILILTTVTGKDKTVMPYSHPSRHQNVNRNVLFMFCLHFYLRDDSECSTMVVNIEICVLDLGYGSENWVLDLCYRNYMC